MAEKFEGGTLPQEPKEGGEKTISWLEYGTPYDQSLKLLQEGGSVEEMIEKAKSVEAAGPQDPLYILERVQKEGRAGTGYQRYGVDRSENPVNFNPPFSAPKGFEWTEDDEDPQYWMLVKTETSSK